VGRWEGVAVADPAIGVGIPHTPLCQKFIPHWTEISKYTKLVNLVARRLLEIIFAPPPPPQHNFNPPLRGGGERLSGEDRKVVECCPDADTQL